MSAADFVGVHAPTYVDKYDTTADLKDGGTYLLNCPWSAEELEERLMAHFNQLEPPEEALRPRPKAPARAPNPRRPPAERPPLRAMVLRLVRGGETRTAELGEGLRRTEGGRWGSGKLLAALEGWVERLPGRGREKEGRRQKLGRLLLKLFEWIRRELYADHHRN